MPSAFRAAQLPQARRLHPMRRFSLLPLAAFAVGTLSAQSNVVPGLDGRLEILDNLTFWARRGAAFPGGEVGMSMRNTMCNPGTVNIPWFAAMQPNHPKFGFLITRVSDGRMVQISDRSYCKHAFTSASVSGGCGTCNGIGGTQMGLRCSDTYSAGNNASQTNLGPPDELDPWLGTWVPVGSYFDRGDPDVGSPANTDGAKSLTASGFDGVKNRVTVKEADLNVAGASYFYGIHLMHQGEAVANRGDNLASRGFVPTWNGTSWSFANNAVGQAWGSILQHWTGANVNIGGNGTSDGRFYVASKVTTIAGGFHYEYAVQNVDNNRGGASLRIPVAAGATVTNLGFRDIDGNALNQWTAARVGNEIVFQAAANNPLNWNSIFNFWFDCTQAPSTGVVDIDQARVGPGALTVSVASDIPNGNPTAFHTTVGTGCAGGTGPCTASVYEQFATPASFDLANTAMGLAFNGTNYTLGAASGTYTAPSGTALTLGDDAEATVALPFTLSYPGGSTTQLFVCSNGFVSPVTNGTDFTPTAGELTGGAARWAAAWHDMNPPANSVRFTSSPTAVRISFTNVPSFTGASSHTFQYEFLSNNQVNIYWQTMTTSGNEYLVGWTAGADGSNPAGSNLSALIPAGNTTLCPSASSVQPLTLNPSARPVLGTTVQMTTSNIPAGSGAQALIYGFTQSVPPIDLTPLGMPGCFAHMPTFEVHSLVASPATTVVTPVTIPSLSSFVGVSVVMQAISYSPPRTPFGWLSSNGIVLFLAAQ